MKALNPTTPRWALAICLWLAASGFASAAAQAELGTAAAPWTIREWIQGGPVSWGGAQDTNIYVIEFWATWCGPCLQSIPHLTRLRRKYQDRGVVFVGVSREEPEAVRPYVRRMGTNMTYAVALDSKDATTRAYLGAFGESAIPRAFVIGRDRRILWTGHPLAGLDEIIQDILEGRYTLERAKAGSEFLRDAQRYLLISSTVGSTPETLRVGKRIVEEAKDQPHLLLQFAQVILFDNRIKGRDLKLALDAANQAVAATKRQDLGALQIYAHALSMSSRREEAIAVVQEAIGRATQPAEKQALESDLAAFRKSPLGTR
ncbi:MAG: TlpA family protein disulfide reductase [Verrucomicrobia bacterium]|nr:TlpA family protein disulfide reductase [Verrucomicrobiota bacterium]